MPDIDKALDLICRGHGYSERHKALTEGRQVVSDYFETITAQDVDAAIATFEHSNDQNERWQVARTLIAYFRWCWRSGKERVGQTDLTGFVALFAKAAFVRIAGADIVSGDEDQGEFLPEWRRPDVAFGKEKPNHPLPENNGVRDIAIAMCVEHLRRAGNEPDSAKGAAARKFGVSVSVVIKAMTFGNKIGYGKRFSCISTADLKAEVEDHIRSLEITTR